MVFLFVKKCLNFVEFWFISPNFRVTGQKFSKFGYRVNVLGLQVIICQNFGFPMFKICQSFGFRAKILGLGRNCVKFWLFRSKSVKGLVFQFKFVKFC